MIGCAVQCCTDSSVSLPVVKVQVSTVTAVTDDVIMWDEVESYNNVDVQLTVLCTNICTGLKRNAISMFQIKLAIASKIRMKTTTDCIVHALDLTKLPKVVASKEELISDNPLLGESAAQVFICPGEVVFRYTALPEVLIDKRLGFDGTFWDV